MKEQTRDNKRQMGEISGMEGPGAHPADFPGEPPVIPEEQITGTVRADYLVLGGGHAGVQCALALAEEGKDVAVVELMAEDKMFWFGEQIGHFNSNFLIGKGLGPYDLDEAVDEFYRCAAYRVNKGIIAKYVKNSGEMIDNMMKLVPRDSTLLDPDCFNIQVAYGDNVAYPVCVGGTKSWAGTIIFRGKIITDRSEDTRTRVMGLMKYSRMTEFEGLALARSRELGARWYFGQNAQLLEKKDGRVNACIARNSEGGYTRFIAEKAVVLTLGGIRSQQGKKLGLWAGGIVRDNYRSSGEHSEVARCFGMTAFPLFNRDGKRFCDESTVYGLSNAISAQPKGLVTAITDAKWLNQIRVNGTMHGNPDFGRPEFIEQAAEDMEEAPKHGAEGYGIRSCALSERELEHCWAAYSLEELAGYLGYEGEAVYNLVESIERYNACCRTGYDGDYGKDPQTLMPIDQPPYYGFKRVNEKKLNLRTPDDGFDTDENFLMLDADGDPVEGLYVAGSIQGGKYALYYPTPVAGNMIGSAMTHGRVLGKELSRM